MSYQLLSITFAEKLATEAKKLVQSIGAVPPPVVESASKSSTATMISSGAVTNTEGTSREMLKQGKHNYGVPARYLITVISQA